MAFPRRQIVGQMYTPAGDVVAAGRLVATLLPAGGLVPDTATATTLYKLTSREYGDITTTGIQSFFLTCLESINPVGAYYRVQFEVTNPTIENWVENWRPTGVNSGNLPISEIVPLPFVLPGGSIFVVGSVGGGGAPGPPGAPGAAMVTLVNSLPTLVSSLRGGLYLHTRASSLGDALYWIGVDQTNVLKYVLLQENL